MPFSQTAGLEFGMEDLWSVEVRGLRPAHNRWQGPVRFPIVGQASGLSILVAQASRLRISHPTAGRLSN